MIFTFGKSNKTNFRNLLYFLGNKANKIFTSLLYVFHKIKNIITFIRLVCEI